jgi:hypothetical protein
MKENSQKYSKLAILIHKIGRALGVQLFLVKLEGCQIELSLLSLLALKNGSSFSGNLFSSLLSLILLVYFVGVTIVCIRISLWLWRQVELLKASPAYLKKIVVTDP